MRNGGACRRGVGRVAKWRGVCAYHVHSVRNQEHMSRPKGGSYAPDATKLATLNQAVVSFPDPSHSRDHFRKSRSPIRSRNRLHVTCSDQSCPD